MRSPDIVDGLADAVAERWQLHTELLDQAGVVDEVVPAPLPATGLVAVGVLALALPFRITPLAAATSLITLCVFALVNLALWRIKRRAPRPAGVPVFPRWVPLAGFLASVGFVAIEAARLASDWLG